MPGVVYRRCQKFMDKLLEIGFWPGCQVTWNDLKPYIERELGADPRTVRLYRERLIQWGFITPLHRRGIFLINARKPNGEPITKQATLKTIMQLTEANKKKELKT